MKSTEMLTGRRKLFLDKHKQLINLQQVLC